MATDSTKLIIEIETILRGLDKTLRGLSQVERTLKRVASVSTGTQGATNLNRATAATQRLQQQQQRAAIAAQRLNQQQQALGIRAQQLANAQTRATQTTARLELAQQRLNATAARVTQGLGAQADAHVRAFRAIERAGQQASQRILSIGNALRSVGQGLASLGATLTVSVTAPLATLGAVSVDAAVRLDSLKRGLAAIVGSADEANRQLARLTQLAKLPGIGFEEAIQGSIRLQAVGFSAAEAEKNLREFANAVALTGGGREELTRVTVQLGQLAAKGKVLSQDLRPIIEAAPAVGRALLQAFGTVNAADIQELGLSSKEFLNTLTEELSRLPRAAAGAKNSFENFRDELFRAAATVGEVLLPALTRFVEVVGPVVVSLANAFAALPGPLQVVIVGVGALLAALGPVLFVVGQLILGVGRLTVGFVELNAAGILPSIASMRAYAASALNAATAQRTLGISTVALTAGLGLLVNAVGLAVGAYLLYNAFQKDALTLSKERADQLAAEIKALEEQAKFLNGLGTGVEQTADEQQRLLGIYSSLNSEAKLRINGISDEEERLAALREELAKVIALRGEELVQAAASATGELANTILRVQANEEARRAITSQIQANARLIETLERERVISDASAKALNSRAIGITTVADATRALRAQSELLSANQDKLIASGGELNSLTKDQIAIVQTMERQTGRTARELLVAAQSMGRFNGDVAAIIPVLERYTQKTDEATSATDRFNRSLSENERRLNEAGERADSAAKRRQTIIGSAAAIARETSVNFEGALKSLRQMVDAVPELRTALRRESELTGKSLNELLSSALESAFKGRAKDKSGTSLRNAQEALAKALADVALASAEQQVRIEQQKNDRLLQAAESGQRLQIISYREFLELRAQLTTDSLNREIGQQREAVKKAQEARIRLLAAAQKAGIPAAERTRRQAQAAEADEEAIKAQTKLIELEARRDLITDALTQALKESSRQQLADIRQLEIRYAELQGRIEDALDTAAIEEFRDSLKDLTDAQDFLNRQLRQARRTRNADRIQQLTADREQNQRQIDSINNQITQRKALAQLAAGEELVRRAKERQAQLEADLAFQVEFRGLKEEEAIQRRLEGERKLNDSLTIAHETIRQIVEALEARGIKPPQALIEFLEQIRTEVKGLGELPFSEQFRLAEKEFTRLNDLRLQKIADVERAVRNRDIAEAEGLLLIRRINGEYVGDLERQLELLKQIAKDSKDANLQRQAQAAGETVKDANDQLASFDRQLRSTSIDALRSGFIDFFQSLRDSTITAQERLLNLIDSVVARINEVIAENLFDELMKSLLGDGTEGGGLIARFKRFLGFGDEESAKAVIPEVAGKAALDTGAAAAAATLQTGATAAAATTTTSATVFATAVSTAATTFATIVTAAASAVAAALAASTAAGGAGSALAGLAATGLYPATPGGVYKVVEGGYPEAVLTTDPKHAARQVNILRELLRRTRGFGGRVPQFATGGFAMPEFDSNLLDGFRAAPAIFSNLSGVSVSTPAGGGRFRFVLTDERSVGDWLNSSEGERVFQDKLVRNRALIRDLGGGR